MEPLRQNEQTAKDSLEAVKIIHKIRPEIFYQGYRYFSFDVASLFIKVLLDKTINIILKPIYKEKLVNLKLLIKEADKR